MTHLVGRELIPYIIRIAPWFFDAGSLIFLAYLFCKKRRANIIGAFGVISGFLGTLLRGCPSFLNGIQLRIPGTDFAAWFLIVQGAICALVAIALGSRRVTGTVLRGTGLEGTG